jgi:DNA-binding PadR family transcriptional regulator
MSPRPALPLRLEYVLLGLIRRQPIHGYELLRIWKDHHEIGLVWQVKPGPLYASLEKLEQLGYLEANRVSTDASPTRKEYRVTPTGSQVFMNWMQTPVAAARDFRQDFLAKLYFSADVEKIISAELLARQIQLCQTWLASLQGQLTLSTDFEKQVLSFRLRQVQGILDWLRALSTDHNFIELRR